MTEANITKEKVLTPYQIKMRDKKNRFARRIYDKTSNFISKLIVKITFFYLFLFLFFVILIVLILSLYNDFLNFNYSEAFLIKTTLKNYSYNNNIINFDVYLSQIFFKFLLLIKYGIIIHFLYSGKSTILDYIPKRSLSRFLIRKLSWFCALIFILKFMILDSFYLEYFLLDWLKNIVHIKYHLG